MYQVQEGPEAGDCGWSTAGRRKKQVRVKRRGDRWIMTSEITGLYSERDGSHWRILSGELKWPPYVLTGFLCLPIWEHPKRDKGGCRDQ